MPHRGRPERRALGREPFDFRPGLPGIVFQAVFGADYRGGKKAVGHVEQMKSSRCFAPATAGSAAYRATTRTGCQPEERIAYFRDQCLACHDTNGCKLPASPRLARSPEDSCVQCHMPKTTNMDVVHVASTDHSIPRFPGESASEPIRNATEMPMFLLNGDDLNPDEHRALGREMAIAVASRGRGCRIRPEHDAPRTRSCRFSTSP